MLRVRFHGRGGQGVKTASRILGTAGFLVGLQAQDSPVYGAERRGAALAAFTRLAGDPIRERGVIPDPDLIVIADETLLDDPAAGVLQGSEFASTVFVNSARVPSYFAGQYRITVPMQTLDLTARTVTALGRGFNLSAPLGAAACALSGLVTFEQLECAVREELASLKLAPDRLEKNRILAEEIYSLVPAVPRQARPASIPPLTLHAVAPLAGTPAVPVILAPGNSTNRHTGSWRLVRPVIERDACSRCCLCFIRCPDSAITLDGGQYPVIDYDNCKGCMICAEECPLHCIHEVKEVRA
jgi:pyruvate ferredoxin oxidoreductase gamma subunit